MDFGTRIQALRKKKKLSQSEFANTLGVTQAHISKLENAQTQPSETFILLVCNAFDVSREWLVDGYGEMAMPFGSTIEDKDFHMKNIKRITDNLDNIFNNCYFKNSDIAHIAMLLSSFDDIMTYCMVDYALGTMLIEKVCYIITIIHGLILNSSKIFDNLEGNSKSKIKVELLKELIATEKEVSNTLAEITNVYIDKVDM